MSTTIPLASPLRRPRVARTVSISIGLLLVLAALIICAVVGGLGSEAAHVFVVALAFSSLLSVIPLVILWFLDRRERESPWLFAAAFLWGGLIATTIAMPANTAVIFAISQWLEHNAALKEMLGPDAALMIGAPLSAPLVEETAKGIGIVLLFWLMRAEFDNVRDGFVYGALVGAGFNWFESALYVQQNFVQFGDAPYGFQLGARYAWLGLAGHAMFSGIFGASLGLARATRSRLRPLDCTGRGYLVAVIAHAWNNSLPLVFAIAASGRRGAADRERGAAGRRPGAGDGADEHLEPGDLPAVRAADGVDHPAQRRGRAHGHPRGTGGRGGTGDHRRRVRRDHGRPPLSHAAGRRHAPGNSAALVNAQNELAFRKRRLRDRGFDPDSDPVSARWREEIAVLRGRLDA